MSYEREIAATEAKIHFGEILDTVVYGNQVAIITKHGKPVAKITRFHDQEDAKEKEAPEWYRSAIAFKKRLGKRQQRDNIRDNISDVELIRQIRREE